MIQLQGVTKVYDGDVHALGGVSMHVAQGELLLLTGPSGAGKTTLLRLIYAGERPDAGRVRVAGRDVSRLTRASIPFLRRNLGVVFQDFKLLPDRTALDNVALALEVQGLPDAEVRDRALATLGDVALAHRAAVRAGRLSAGEQQRVAIARALAPRPAVLLCDEPTGNLDPDLTRGILELLLAQSRRGTTVVVATHDPQVMAFGSLHGCRSVRLVAGRVDPACAVDAVAEVQREAASEPAATGADAGMPGEHENVGAPGRAAGEAAAAVRDLVTERMFRLPGAARVA